MEGKEVRFGVLNSALWATCTTAASNGSVNAMHDSFLPLAGLVPMLLMQLGEVVFGGVGSGLYGMIVFALITVFIAVTYGGRNTGISRKENRGFRGKNGIAGNLNTTNSCFDRTAVAVSLECGLSQLVQPRRTWF